MISVSMEAKSNAARAAAAVSGDIVFGTQFADLMLTAVHDEGVGWHGAKIGPFENFSLSPAAKVLHYGVEIFEGHKVYRMPSGEVALFRPEMNVRRLNRSAERICMPTLPEAFQLEALDRFVDAIRDWVPSTPQSSLYLRPAVIGIEPALGVKPSRRHLYFVIASPAASYFLGTSIAISVRVETDDVRAAAGGTGFAKAGGNYGGGMAAKKRALDAGYDEVLWLDAAHRRYIEELGAMNAFIVRDGVIVTPPVSSTILDGITRNSLLTLAAHLGIPCVEEPLEIDSVIADLESGRISELAAVGTAAVVTPIQRLGCKGRDYRTGDGSFGPILGRLYTALTDIQTGRAPDPFGWMHTVAKR